MEFERECETKVTEPLCDYSNHISWFRLQDCFTRLGANCCDYSPVYCWGNIEILLFTFCYSIVLSFLLYFHFSKHSPKQWKTWTKEKTWIFLLAVPVELFVFIRFFFQDVPKIVTVIPDTLLPYVVFLICYYFVRKSSGLLSSNENIMNFMRVVMGVSFFIYIGTYIANGLLEKSDETELCNTLFFAVPNTFRLFVGLIFVTVGVIIHLAINQFDKDA